LSYLEDNAPHMAKLYSRVLGLMEEKKPWLDGDFCVGQLAKRLFCNRSFLSRTINICSGHNFRWLVNYYRIVYAAELMKKDPHMKVEEVAKMSGFNTLPTFNYAFKLLMKERPSEFLAKVRREATPRPLSRWRALLQ
ncbi:MAG: AraC family transcriptional regulator, partial [Bacteroidales bacterium]|nr:AraC family transcriptional regulator [Bacteroidales bacterium]